MVILSKIVTNGKLTPYKEWCNYIDLLKTNIVINNEKVAVEELRPVIEDAINKRIPPQKFGIFLSGGVDSTLIAYLLKKKTDNFVCYTVGIEGSKDIESSTKVAKALNLTHTKKILTLKESEILFEETARLLGKNLINIVNIGVGSVVFAGIQLAREDNIKIFFTGLGSEEIFAGYKRHESAIDINEECWDGLKSMWQRDFQRDFAIATHTNSTFLTPFLDKDLIVTAMKVDGKLKIKNSTKKYILRKLAVDLGLPEEFAFRPKIAAQYGSNFDKAITRIAKSNGFKYKKQYLDYLTGKI